MWYLSDRTWPGPNIVLLNNALLQTGWDGPTITTDNWRNEIITAISSLSWENVLTDLRPFIEKLQDLQMLTKDNLIKLLKN